MSTVEVVGKVARRAAPATDWRAVALRCSAERSALRKARVVPVEKLDLSTKIDGM